VSRKLATNESGVKPPHSKAFGHKRKREHGPEKCGASSAGEKAAARREITPFDIVKFSTMRSLIANPILEWP